MSNMGHFMSSQSGVYTTPHWIFLTCFTQTTCTIRNMSENMSLISQTLTEVLIFEVNKQKTEEMS